MICDPNVSGSSLTLHKLILWALNENFTKSTRLLHCMKLIPLAFPVGFHWDSTRIHLDSEQSNQSPIGQVGDCKVQDSFCSLAWTSIGFPCKLSVYPTLNNAKRFATVECIKQKSDAAQAIINYLAYLKTQGRNPKEIQINCGKEFINEKLENWCKEHGMEICYTVPYSPSQNDISEWMNCTLVKLSQVMIIANDLPAFFWEHAVLNAAYLCNLQY